MTEKITAGALKEKIIAGVSGCLEGFGLTKGPEHVFSALSSDVMRIVQVSFLDTRHASYFGTGTASFSLEYGAIYTPISSSQDRNDFPAVHYCQVRGVLMRDYSQRAPKSTLPAVEHKRRDIWWVDPSGKDVERVIGRANAVLQRDLGRWLDRLASYEYLGWYLLWRNQSKVFYGFGARRSPARRDLMALINHRLPRKTLLAWLTNRRLTWLTNRSS